MQGGSVAVFCATEQDERPVQSVQAGPQLQCVHLEPQAAPQAQAPRGTHATHICQGILVQTALSFF